MDLPKVPPFNTDAVPVELKQRRQWICWRFDLNEDGKITKVPVAPWVTGDLRRVSATNPNNITDFETAVSYARKHAIGIGFAFFKGAGIVGIDLDKLDQLGEEAQQYIKTANSYAEYSPSGKGVHIYGYGELKKAIKKAGIEVYGDARFFTVTGNHVEGTPMTLGNIQPLLDELMAKYGEDPTVSDTVEARPHSKGGWEDYVNRLGYTLKEIREKDKVLDEYLSGGLAGKPSDSEADMGTLERLLFWGYEPDEAVAILEKYRWREKLQRRDYIEDMLKKLLPVHETAKPKTSPPITLPPASEISETFTFTGDRTFRGRVQVGALTTPLSRFMRLRFKCKDPGECKVADCPLCKGLILSVDDAKRFDPSAFATYFDTNNPVDALSVYAEKRAFSRCAEWRKKVIYRGRDERAVTGALVYDLTGREGRAWFIHGERCDLRRAPNWIIAEGWLCRGYKGRIGVLVQAFVSESEVMAPPAEEVEKARAVLKAVTKVDNGLEGSAVWHIAELLRRKVNAKGEEVKKGFAADLLLVASPVWVKTPESGDRELGATICELGPSTNYKSQRARFLVEWLGAGKYLRGRKTEAGLTAGLEKVEGLGWIAKKGALPSADLSFIIVDNAPPHALDEQIESRRDGIVSMAGIKSMEIWARTRLKLLNNPVQPFDELVYKCVSLKMFDSKLIARMAFAIYTYGVNIEDRYDPSICSLTAEEEAVLEAARTVLRWNLSQETTHTVPLNLWAKVMEFSKQLELKYGCEDIPLLLRNIPYKLAVLAYSFALLEGEIEPSERHYKLAYEWLDFCARDIELDKYAEVQRSLRNLNDEEYSKICKVVEEDIAKDVQEHGGEREDSYLYKLMDYLVKHGTARCDELAAYLEVDNRTVMRKAQLLKGLGLLRSSKNGYAYTPKGVRFIKRWHPYVTDVTDVTNFKGHTRVEGAPETSLTPERSDINDMSDTNKQQCERCGGLATTRIVRVDGVHWLCGKCLADWEGKL